MRKELFMPTVESEARLLLLINGFTTTKKSLEGRTKLAKLDFFLRYPKFLERALAIKKPDLDFDVDSIDEHNIEGQMLRYRYGPWDPAYYAILGRLIGKGLVKTIPLAKGVGYRATDKGQQIASKIAKDDSWSEIASRTKLLKKYLDLSGSNLKNFVYKYFPEVVGVSWGEKL